MIPEVSGDIHLSKTAAIVHSVAPRDHFNQGLALALPEQWPSMARDFRHWCHQSHPKPGAAWIWSGTGARIICLLTQEEATGNAARGGKAHVEHVNHALKTLRQMVKKEAIKSLALPRLATGVGVLAWSEVKPLIAHHLGDLDIPVYLYVEYHPKQATNEKLESTTV